MSWNYKLKRNVLNGSDFENNFVCGKGFMGNRTLDTNEDILTTDDK